MTTLQTFLHTPLRKLAAAVTAFMLLVLGGMVVQGPASAKYQVSDFVSQSTDCDDDNDIDLSDFWDDEIDDHVVLGDDDESDDCDDCDCEEDDDDDVLDWWDEDEDDEDEDDDEVGGFEDLFDELDELGFGAADVTVDADTTVDSVIESAADNVVDIQQDGDEALQETDVAVDAANDVASVIEANSDNEVDVDQSEDGFDEATVDATANTDVASEILSSALNDITIQQDGGEESLQSANVDASATNTVTSVIEAGSSNTVNIQQ